MKKEKKGRTAADSGQSGWPIVAAKAKQSSRAGAANENRNCKNFKTLEKKQKRGRTREDNLVASYERIRDLFQNTPERISTSEEEIFIDFTSRERVKN
ncbi:hypothetical protein TNCV_4946001 [Trichonephila clavipes]|nr:hypothetical protein TNCV_4946001 [Trichonephila clavipes]